MLTVSPITGPQQLQPIHLWSGEVEHSVFHGVGSSAGQDDTKMFESMAMPLCSELCWYHFMVSGIIMFQTIPTQP